MDFLRGRFPSFVLLFILLQPMIDLLTSISMAVLKTEATFGLIFRFAFMVVGLLYVVFIRKKRWFTAYLVVLGLLFIVNLAVNFRTKPIFDVMAEVKFLAKAAYFIGVLFFYLVGFQQLRQWRPDWEMTVRRNLYYAMAISGATILIAMLTGTEFSSYQTHFKVGTTGWFYSGNEVGAIAAMVFPVVVLYALEKTKSWRSLFYWVPVALTAFVLLMLGTKVGYFAGLITLVILVGSGLLVWVRDRRVGVRRLQAIFVSGAFLLFVGSTPFAPIAANTAIHRKWIESRKQVPQPGQPPTPPDPRVESELANLLLSSRDVYLHQHKAFYAAATPLQKAFGMGYAGNYTREPPKVIEMDFYDLFYSFGYVGTIVYLLPLLWLAYEIARQLLKRPSQLLSVEILTVSISLLLGLGIAFTAGHVLFAPAASIYLAVLLAYLYHRAGGEV